MGYRGDSLTDLVPQSAESELLEAAKRTADRVGRELLRLTKHYTPVAKPPPGAAAEWLASRGRMPGTLRESWRVGEVMVDAGGRKVSVDVYTLDPVAPHVEYPTMPHLIFPRRAQRLRFWDKEGNTIYAYVVLHPGTHGSFMLTTALAEVDRLWQQIAAEELERWAREVTARI